MICQQRLKSICINYLKLKYSLILSSTASDVEHGDEVMHAIQLRFRASGSLEANDDDLSDYGIDTNVSPVMPSSDDVRKSITPTSDGKSWSKQAGRGVYSLVCMQVVFL